MSNQYHKNLVEAVGSSFYYYAHHKDFDLINGRVDFESFTSGWIKKYHGDWDIYSKPQPMVCNTFKPCVDQLVYRIMDATEKEIERQVNERVNKYLTEYIPTKDK
jgi:hypothetical protein